MKNIQKTLQEVVLLNAMRGKDLSWVEVFSLFNLIPSQVTLKNQTTIDPFWVFTQSYKNYTPSPFGNTLSVRLIRTYSHNPFDLQRSSYGVSSTLNSSYNMWLLYALYSDWYDKQRFAIDYFRTIKSVPGIISIELIGSSNIKLSKENSDVDVFVTTEPGFTYTTRAFIKSLLKLANRDVHVWYAELVIQISKFSKKLVPQSSKKVRKNAENIISQSKFDGKNTKIDTGIITSEPKKVDSWYGFESRQLLWLHQRSILSFDYTNALQSIGSERDHILYTGEDLIHRVGLLNRLSIFYIYAFWIISLPLSVIIRVYYLLKHQTATNFLVDRNSICFVPKIYKDGYYTKVDSSLDKT